MSGVSMRATFDDAVLRRHLAALALARPEKFTAVLQDIGEDIVGDVQDNIQAQRLVDGSAMWQSQAAIDRKGKTLLDHGNLRDSYVYQVSGGTLQVGSNMAYAAIHHFGGRAGRGKKTFIACRPVLGVNARREAGVARKLGQALLELGP